VYRIEKPGTGGRRVDHHWTDDKGDRNLAGYYKGLGWPGCPHLFRNTRQHSDDESINDGRHTFPSWNSISWGIETVGEFDRDLFTGSIKDNLFAALAILHAAVGLPLLPYERGVQGLHFHKEDPRTTHTSHALARTIVKADLIKAVQAEIQRRNPGEHPLMKVEISAS